MQGSRNKPVIYLSCGMRYSNPVAGRKIRRRDTAHMEDLLMPVIGRRAFVLGAAAAVVAGSVPASADD